MTLLYTTKNKLYTTRVYKKFAWLPKKVWVELPGDVEAQEYIWLEHYLIKDIYSPTQGLSDRPIVHRLLKY